MARRLASLLLAALRQRRRRAEYLGGRRRGSRRRAPAHQGALRGHVRRAGAERTTSATNRCGAPTLASMRGCLARAPRSRFRRGSCCRAHRIAASSSTSPSSGCTTSRTTRVAAERCRARHAAGRDASDQRRPHGLVDSARHDEGDRQGGESELVSAAVDSRRARGARRHPAAIVPPGPDNPLGKHALRLGLPGYLIHGTNMPSGVGMRVTHGCIRMFPEDIEALYKTVPIGTPVTDRESAGQARLDGRRRLVPRGASAARRRATSMARAERDRHGHRATQGSPLTSSRAPTSRRLEQRRVDTALGCGRAVAQRGSRYSRVRAGRGLRAAVNATSSADPNDRPRSRKKSRQRGGFAKLRCG